MREAIDSIRQTDQVHALQLVEPSSFIVRLWLFQSVRFDGVAVDLAYRTVIIVRVTIDPYNGGNRETFQEHSPGSLRRVE